MSENESDREPRILYLLQGVPGSGRSEIARFIRDAELKRGGAVIVSVGNEDLHRVMQRSCAMLMLEKTYAIIVDGPNIQEWEVHPYLILAEIFGYQVRVVSVDSGLKYSIEAEPNIDADQISEMYWKMERLLANPHFMPENQNQERHGLDQ